MIILYNIIYYIIYHIIPWYYIIFWYIHSLVGFISLHCSFIYYIIFYYHRNPVKHSQRAPENRVIISPLPGSCGAVRSAKRRCWHVSCHGSFLGFVSWGKSGGRAGDQWKHFPYGKGWGLVDPMFRKLFCGKNNHKLAIWEWFIPPIYGLGMVYYCFNHIILDIWLT